jgi:pyruvate/2-oxoacid:ferredoxin oxidoreductase beta subunit
MPHQQIKFYQVGSFVAGNRLLRPDERSVQARMERSNTLTSGHRACQGCGEALGARYALDAAMRATGGQLVAANATGCLEVFSTPYPESSWQLPWLHSLFGNAPAVASGIAAALKAKGRLRLLQGLRPLRRRVSIGRHRDGAGDDLTEEVVRMLEEQRTPTRVEDLGSATEDQLAGTLRNLGARRDALRDELSRLDQSMEQVEVELARRGAGG